MTRLRFEISTEVPNGEVVVTNCLAGVMNEQGDMDCVRIRAMWDTGSTESAIMKRVADDLKLANMDRHNVDTASGGKTSMEYSGDVYFVLSEGLTAHPKRVDVIDTGKDDNGNYNDMGLDAIIGLDIISHGTLTMEPSSDGLGTKFTFVYYGDGE